MKRDKHFYWLFKNVLRLSIMILYTGEGQGQNLMLIFTDMQNVDTTIVFSNEVDSLINEHLAILKAEGYWDAKITLHADSVESGSLTARIDHGALAQIDQVHFMDMRNQDAPYLEREFFMGRTSIGFQNLPLAENRLKDLGYYFSQAPALYKDERGKYHLEYKMSSRPELNMDILAAFNQTPGSDTLTWFGHVNLLVPNIDGRGKSIQLNWQSLKANSEYFSIGYNHPWLFNLPLNASLQFRREVVDGNYQIIRSYAGLAWSMTWERSLIFQVQEYQSIITLNGTAINSDWRSIRRKMMGVGFRQTDLDRRTHSGFAVKTSFDREFNFDPQSVSRFTLLSEYEVSLFPKIYISQKSSFLLQSQQTVKNDPSLMEPLGGLTSVRGYTENLIRSPSVISLQHDLYLSLGEDSQVLALLDFGIYYGMESVKYLTGYGVGVELRSTTGPIRLVFATHKGLTLRNSFLHIEYSRGMSWIDQ